MWVAQGSVWVAQTLAWHAGVVRVPLRGERRVICVQQSYGRDQGPVTVTELKVSVVAQSPA